MDLDKRINEVFTPENLKALEGSPADLGPAAHDQEKKIETRGRKNRGLTLKHYEQKKADRKELRRIKQKDHFNNDILERVTGEIIIDDDLEAFRELYNLTCETVLDDFRKNNPELINKHPYNYFKKILIAIKESTPKISADDIEKCVIVWDCLSRVLDSIGLYITFETFEKVTGIYKYQLKNKCGVSPRYADFIQKITNDCDSALVNELQYNPYNQTNKIFIAKVHGIIEKTEPKQVEVTHTIQNYDNIARYRLDDHEKS